MQLASSSVVHIPMTEARPSRFAYRIQLGCAYEPQLPGVYGILLMRHRPPRRLQATVHDLWSRFAPSHFLVTGRVSGDAFGNSHQRGANLQLGWDVFATAYRDELDALGEQTRQLVRAQLLQLQRFHPRVMLLSPERALGGFEPGARTQRRLFKDWLLGRPLDLRDNLM